MSNLAADLRFALRAMRKSPGFTLVAILTLALGLGANTAIYSFVDGVLLRPLPFPHAEQLVEVWEKPPGYTRNGISALNYLDWTRQNTVFSYMAAVTGGSVTLSTSSRPEQLKVRYASASYFDLFGTKAILGRTFARDEDQLGKQNVVVLTNRIWQSRFGGDPHVIGRVVTLDGKPSTIVGVLPANTMYDREWAEIWMPLAFRPDNLTRDYHWLRAYARLKPGVTFKQAQAQMDSIGARLAKEYPEADKGWGVHLDQYQDRVVGDSLRKSLWVLLAAVGAVLLICCANIANLMLARGTARDREVAIRSALGAGRARLIRQFLTENILLSLIGGAVGVVLGYGLMRAIKFWMPPFMLPPQADVRMDFRVLLVMLALAALTGVLFGLAPALQATRRDSAELLKEGGRSATGGVSRHRLRGALIVSEVALAFVLLTGAGLLIRSFERLLNVDAGFDSTNVITMQMPMSAEQNTDPVRLTNYMDQVAANVEAVPGVRDASFASVFPLEGWSDGMPFQIVGHAFVDVSHRPGCSFKTISPSYFHALGMKLLEGRALSDSDRANTTPVTVVNETMVKRYFPHEDPIGKRILIQQILTGKTALGPEIPWQVVGVVKDEKLNGLDDNSSPGIYISYRQSPGPGLGLLVRGAGDPAPLVKSIEQAVWQVNKEQAITEVKTLEQIKAQSVAPNRLRTILLAIFAGLAMLLSAVGIYGVISYSTAQRTHELGIRAALGARAIDLLKLVISHAMLLSIAGLILGFLGSLALTRLLASLLFNTSATDVPTMVAVAAMLILVALAACYIPARRATKVDPMVALRYE